MNVREGIRLPDFPPSLQGGISPQILLIIGIFEKTLPDTVLICRPLLFTDYILMLLQIHNLSCVREDRTLFEHLLCGGSR